MVFVDGYPMDLAESATIGMESEITSHPVESGSMINDHVRIVPTTVELRCIVSNTPIGAVAAHATRTSSGVDTPLPADEAYARLVAIRDGARPVVVETARGVFRDMILSLSVVDDKASAGGLFFTATFRPLRITDTKRVTVAIPGAKMGASYGHRAGSKEAPKVVVWRKGRPPGSSTVVGTEKLSVKGGAYLHEDGKPLDASESQALAKDLARDEEKRAARSGKKRTPVQSRLERADLLAKARAENPGKHIDPLLFGL